MKSILVVEDEFDVRMNLKELLESEDYNVLVAEDGEIGFELAKKYQPDLVISDIKMPRLDGFELLKKMQDNPETDRIPFVFLTAKVEMSDFREGMSLGVDDYLTKPFRIDDVLKAIETRLKKRDLLNKDLEQLRDSLLRRVPHELRTPLVGIIGFSQLIEENAEDIPIDDLKTMVGKIHKSGKRLHRRIEKFLLYAELLAENKKEQMVDSMYEVNSEILKGRLHPLLEDFDRFKDLEIMTREGKLIIDEKYYEIILKELVENALKFSLRDTPIRINGERNEHYYKTRIEDFGCGMSENSLKHINALTQFRADKYLEEGVGLGLAVVQKILSLSNGYLTVDSKLNEHTVIEFGVPLEQGV
jgi:two-component system, sensor histidine kinase and response regulator